MIFVGLWAAVRLAADGSETLLRYTATATVGGKLAQIGSRLIDGAARKMADDFFSKFTGELGSAEPEAVTPAEAAAGSVDAAVQPEPIKEQEKEQKAYQPSQQWVIWAIMFGVLILAVVLTL